MANQATTTTTAVTATAVNVKREQLPTATTAACDVTVHSGSRQLKHVTLRLLKTAPVAGSQIVLTDDIIQQLIRTGKAEVVLSE